MKTELEDPCPSPQPYYLEQMALNAAKIARNRSQDQRHNDDGLAYDVIQERKRDMESEEEEAKTTVHFEALAIVHPDLINPSPGCWTVAETHGTRLEKRRSILGSNLTRKARKKHAGAVLCVMAEKKQIRSWLTSGRVRGKHTKTLKILSSRRVPTGIGEGRNFDGR